MKILIATPAYGGQITTACCESLIGLISHFREKRPDIRFEHKFLSASLQHLMRNVYANMVMQDESYTHLLFVDADMGFAPSLIEHMIAADKPIVGAMSPARQFHVEKLYEMRNEITDADVARLVAIDYVSASSLEFVDGTKRDGEPRPPTSLVVDGPCVRVRYAGTGILLIKREVFDRLKERYPELCCVSTEQSYGQFGLTGDILQCFQPMPNDEGVYDGEDMAFCRRWREGCGGEIWAVVTETIVHVGTQRFVGNYLTKLQHGRM